MRWIMAGAFLGFLPSCVLVAQAPLSSTYLSDSSSLVAYYRFDGNANDSKGTNDGTPSSNMSFDTSYGLFSQGEAYFNGSAEITIPNDLLGNTQARAIGVWFKRGDTATAREMLSRAARSSGE